ncbi:hypothetical protein RB195_010620 [Necator americanus]|uniref:Uncharacterized protein n=1 Tax=Necator americanus TaxID=51031 RepID=A0ABR1CYP8_NECAM
MPLPEIIETVVVVVHCCWDDGILHIVTETSYCAVEYAYSVELHQLFPYRSSANDVGDERAHFFYPCLKTMYNAVAMITMAHEFVEMSRNGSMPPLVCIMTL